MYLILSFFCTSYCVLLLIAPNLQVQEVFRPALQYLKAEQFDAARTNTNYIMRQLNLKRTIDSLIVSASDVVDDADLVSMILLLLRPGHRALL